MTKLENLIEGMKSWERFGLKQITEWQEKLNAEVAKSDGDTLYTFTWSDDTIKYAAKVKVARTVISWSQNASHEQIIKEATQRAMEGAKWPSQSTSAMTNFTKQLEVALWAEIASGSIF